MALAVQQQITRLQITVQEIGRVHVLQTLETLVYDVLLVYVLKDVCSNDRMEIRVHEVENEVDVPIVLGSDCVLKANDVLMAIQLLQKDDLAEGPLRISRVLEGIKVLLESNDLLGPLVNGFPDNSVGTLAKLLDNFILLEDVGLDFLCHF